jgi:hypothetical protein
MIAQLYNDADYVRIFETNDDDCLMDCCSRDIAPIGRDQADIALRRCGLRRTGKWKKYEFMWEAPVGRCRPKDGQ